MLLIGVGARAVKEGDRDDGGQIVPVLFTMAAWLQPLQLNAHTAFMCVRMHEHSPAKLLNTLYIFILGDESRASN